MNFWPFNKKEKTNKQSEKQQLKKEAEEVENEIDELTEKGVSEEYVKSVVKELELAIAKFNDSECNQALEKTLTAVEELDRYNRLKVHQLCLKILCIYA